LREKILVCPSHAEISKDKNIIIGESREKVKPSTKKSKPTFDESSAKYKKGNAHIKSRENQNIQKVKLELLVSRCQADVPVAS
jgi:hypothetical protein